MAHFSLAEVGAKMGETTAQSIDFSTFFTSKNGRLGRSFVFLHGKADL